MFPISKLVRTTALLSTLLPWALPARAQTPEAIAKAAVVAETAAVAVHADRFGELWDRVAGAYLKGKVPSREAFVAGMSRGREQLGRFSGMRLIRQGFATRDQQARYEGEIYSFDYVASYQAGDFLERYVVTRQGEAFVLAGMWTFQVATPPAGPEDDELSAITSCRPMPGVTGVVC